MKFDIIDLKSGGYQLKKQTDADHSLIHLGNIYLYKQNCIEKSFSFQNVDEFNYHEIEMALCGKEPQGYDGFILIKKFTNCISTVE
jgi:hypothetical protein